MKLRNLFLIGVALPLLSACVAYDDPYYNGGQAYYGGGAPAYYGDAYPTHTYIEYNNSYSHRGGYRENYWAHDRAREENQAREHRDDHHDASPRPVANDNHPQNHERHDDNRHDNYRDNDHGQPRR